MEGLEISEIMLSYARNNNDVFRFDSNYFQKEYLLDEVKIRSKKFKTLKSLNADIKSFGAYSLNNDVTYLEEGIPFIRGVNMKKGRISFNDMIFIDEQTNSLLWKSEVKPEMILLSMSGTIGDVALASKQWKYPINSNQDIAKIDVKGKVNSHFLYAFLMSKFGQNYLKREARGSVQQHVFLSQIELFEVPSISLDLESAIQHVIEKSDALLIDSENLYKQAENLLLEDTGLKDFSPSTESVNIKSFNNSFGATGRLDSEYYQPKYESYEQCITNYKKGFTQIANEYKIIKHVSDKSKPAYDYIEIGDVNVEVGEATFNHIDSAELPDNAKYEVKRGDLLISKVRPNRGAVAIIDFDDTDLIVSGAFTVLREKSNSVFSNETLKILLRTKIYRDWLLKFNIGTQYPVIRDEDILNLIVPKIEENVQIKISALVQKSFVHRAESQYLLDIAKHAVELAIEESEGKAISFIAKQMKD